MDFSLNQLLRCLIITLLFPLLYLNFWLVFSLFQYFQPLVTILILATLLSFILNYPVSVLQDRGVSRNYAVILVFLSTIIILVTLGITLAPVVLEQFNEIAKLLPKWIDATQEKLTVNILTNIINRIPNELEHIGNRIFSILLDTLDSISEALVTLVLTFYLLLDGERIAEGIIQKLPLGLGESLRKSLQQNFQNYLIGQINLALLMGISETLVFLIFQVEFGLLFGLGVGFLSLIPFGDVVSLIIITLIIASHDFWLAVKILAIIFVIDQLIDQVIAPRLLGKFTGLRPIWIIISLLIGTYVAGVLGLLIAVPIAGFIKDALEQLSLDTDEQVNVK